MPDTQRFDSLGGSKAAAISNAVVRLLSEYTGRGPTKARTYINDNLVSVVLHDSLTKGERSLVDDGQVAHVLQTRRHYQSTMERELVELIEETLDRKVVAFLSDNHIGPDVAVESFVLEPHTDGSSDGAAAS
jgi:uncharacterized protein YbcI